MAIALPGAALLLVVAARLGLCDCEHSRWAVASFGPWWLMFGLGTLIGIAGLVLFLRQRKTFADFPPDLPQ